MLDVSCAAAPARGERVHADVAVRAGGSAVNAARAAAAAGAAACVVGRIGADPIGELVEGSIREVGIDAQLARDAKLPTGTVVALGVAAPAVVASRGANARLDSDDVPVPLDADALLVSGFALLQPGSALAAHTALERFSGSWAGVDLGSPTLAAGADLEQVAVRANVVLATADEARAATGAEPEAAAATLAARFRVACVKLGDAGAIAATGDRLEHASAPPVERTVPFGAGDAFGATLLVALAQGDELGTALARACAAGAAAASS
jgi:sugar/nucleoside kinase (ribokinase family)